MNIKSTIITKILSILFFLFFYFLGFTQTINQTIRGRVIHKDSQTPLIGVTIVVLDSNPIIGIATDVEGYFELENVPVGHHQLEISYVGFETMVLSEILVSSGKEQVLEIEMTQLPASLSVVDVVGKLTSIDRSSAPVSLKTLSIEETLRYPATFYDPARLAVSFAGVVNNNDQANGISIRGYSPNFLSWQLEGVEIVNPNHTNNAGTLSDRPTTNGGGVNILSAQLLGNSNFFTGGFPAGYNNALSGILDMQLRKGNEKQAEYTAQIGLLGIDVAAEGPFSQNSRASYLVNYRYSTLGLLNQLGVELGDEAIDFQDLAFNINVPTKKGKFSLFGMGGISNNVFIAQRDTSLWEFEKDNQDIRYRSTMGALGATYTQSIGQNTVWKSSAAYSTVNARRQSDLLDVDLNLTEKFREDELTQTKLAFHSTLQHKINNKNRIKVGLKLTNYQNTVKAIQNFEERIIDGEMEGLLLSPYFNWQTKWKTRLTINAGLQYNFFTFNNTQNIEPRISASYQLPADQKISLSYGWYSQLQQPQHYFSLDQSNTRLGFTKSSQAVLAYQKQINNQSAWDVELYYHYLWDVPSVSLLFGGQSALNLLDEIFFVSFENNSEGRNYGAEVSYQRYIYHGLYWLSNASLYRSEYRLPEEDWNPTRYDGNYIFNFTLGKEWDKLKENKIRTFGLNGRITYLGGFRENSINENLSALSGTTEYDFSNPFSIKQKDYFKIDLRLYLKRNKPKYTSTLALDIQNLSNQKNIAYRYYDTAQEAVVTKNQLGLIPILSYRIEF